MRVLALLLTFLAGTTALSQPYDSVVAGRGDLCRWIAPLLSHSLEWTGGGPFVLNGDVIVVAPGPGGRIFAAVHRFPSAFAIVELRPDGSQTPISTNVPGSALAMVVDAAGSVYVLTRSAVVAVDPSGTVRATHPTMEVDWGEERTAIDLAADQCTLYIASGDLTVSRLNVCTGAPLGNFVTLHRELAYAVRVLPDGDVLVSTDGRLARFDANGTPVASYAFPAALQWPGRALMLRDGGSRLLVGQAADCQLGDFLGGWLSVVDLNTGQFLSSTRLRVEFPTSIAAYFGWTAALGSFHLADAPVNAPLAIAFLAAALIAFALLRLR